MGDLLSSQGGSGSTDISAANVFTFRPGSGLTGPSVFDVFDDLYNALDARRTANDNGGWYKIILDDQDIGGPGSPVEVRSPGGNFTYDLYNTVLAGVHQDQNVLANIGDPGGEGDSMEIINALWIEGLTIRADGTVTPFVAQSGQTFTLTRTTLLGGGGEYVMDFLGPVTDCIIHLNDESVILRADGAGNPTVFPAGTAAIRINTSTVTVHMNGANCQVNGNAFITGGAGVLVAIVNSSSARFNFDQADVGGVTGTMSTAAGYWTAGPAFPTTDPNGNLTATVGTIIVDEATGDTWQNTDGATAWSLFGGGADADAVIFDDAVPADKRNIRSDRALFQSAIDNTKVGLTNLGSQDGSWNGLAVGATADFATISGGIDNEATVDNAVVAGGAGNSATGYAAAVGGGYLNQATAEGACVPGGEENLASGEGSCAIGALNTATDFWSFAQGVFSNATNSNAIAMGQSCDATGDSCVAMGAGTLASGNAAMAVNSNNDATGDYSFACGNGCVAMGAYSQAMGSGCTADGFYSHAQGASTQTTDDFAHAQNFGTVAAFGGHAEGDSCQALGDFSHAEGRLSVANGKHSHAQGAFADALRETQFTMASGVFGATGDAQTSALVLRGSTPGLGINETVELLFGQSFDQQLTCENAKAYAFKVTAVIGGTQAGPLRRSRTIEIKFNVRRDAGVTTLVASGTGDAYGDASTATWTLTPTIGAAPDRVVLTFNTGAGVASACSVAAHVEFTEVLY